MIRTIFSVMTMFISTVAFSQAGDRPVFDDSQNLEQKRVEIDFVRNGEIESQALVDVSVALLADGNVAVEYSPVAATAETPSTESKLQHFRIDLEGGPGWVTSNDISVPGPTGTRFSATDGPFPAFRAYFQWFITKNHTLRLLYAPLKVSTALTPGQNISFNGLDFAAGVPVDFTYQFNGYRLSYIYQFDPIGNLVFRVGFTANIRDAYIDLNDGSKATRSSNLGFVPLVNLGLRYDFLKPLFLEIDIDAIAGIGPGRAEDASIAVGAQINPNVALSLGYRVVEGGANVKQVYNFALINYLFARLTASF